VKVLLGDQLVNCFLCLCAAGGPKWWWKGWFLGGPAI